MHYDDIDQYIDRFYREKEEAERTDTVDEWRERYFGENSHLESVVQKVNTTHHKDMRKLNNELRELEEYGKGERSGRACGCILVSLTLSFLIMSIGVGILLGII